MSLPWKMRGGESKTPPPRVEELLVRIKHPVKVGSYDFAGALNHTVVLFVSRRDGAYVIRHVNGTQGNSSHFVQTVQL